MSHNATEHLLTLLMEECAEVTQRAAKAKRFGLTEVQPGQSEDNAERLAVEIDDLLVIIQMIRTKGLIRQVNASGFLAKSIKVQKFAQLSIKLGTLSEPLS